VCQTYLGEQITVLLLQASNLALSLLLVVGHLQDQLLQRLILCLTPSSQSTTQSINQPNTFAVLKFGTLQPKAATFRHKHVGNGSILSLGNRTHGCGRKHKHFSAG